MYANFFIILILLSVSWEPHLSILFTSSCSTLRLSFIGILFFSSLLFHLPFSSLMSYLSAFTPLWLLCYFLSQFYSGIFPYPESLVPWQPDLIILKNSPLSIHTYSTLTHPCSPSFLRSPSPLPPTYPSTHPSLQSPALIHPFSPPPPPIIHSPHFNSSCSIVLGLSSMPSSSPSFSDYYCS